MRRKSSLILMTVLLVSTFICSGIFTYADSGKDVTSKVSISDVTLSVIKGSESVPIIKNGTKVSDDACLKVGDSVKMEYEWSISEENMEGVSAGDYFTIQLPDNEYINSSENTYDLKNSEGVLLGTYSVSGRVLTVTFNEKAAEQSELSDGWFNIFGKVVKAGENVDIAGNGSVIIPIKPGTGSGGGGNHGGGGNDAGKNEITSDKIKFTKDGKQYSGKNRLNWHMNVNYDGLQQMICGEAVTDKSNVILEDELPDYLTADIGSVYITTPLFVPTPENKMSGFSIGYIKIAPTVLYAEENESYEDFYQRVKKSGKISVGIYDKNGKNNILFGFGNLPGNGITYADMYGGADKFNTFIDSCASKGDITSQQAERMKTVYGADGTASGQIVGYDVSFDTDVEGESGKYSNIARLEWDNAVKTESEFTIEFSGVSAGITGKEKTSVSVEKIWVGKPAASVTILLFQNGHEYAKKEITAADDWKYTFKKLPKYDADKKLIEYTVDEEAIEGYEKTLSGNKVEGFKIENKQLPPEKPKDPEPNPNPNPNPNPGTDTGRTPGTPSNKVEKPSGKVSIIPDKDVPLASLKAENFDIKVVKEWTDKDGNVVPAFVDNIEVALYRDGLATGMTAVLSKDNGWTAIFRDLEIAEQGTENTHNYIVKEVGEIDNHIKLAGMTFDVSYSGSPEEGFKIINRKSDIIIEDPLPPTAFKISDDSPVLPQTGCCNGLIVWFASIGLILTAAGVLLIRKSHRA